MKWIQGFYYLQNLKKPPGPNGLKRKRHQRLDKSVTGKAQRVYREDVGVSSWSTSSSRLSFCSHLISCSLRLSFKNQRRSRDTSVMLQCPWRLPLFPALCLGCPWRLSPVSSAHGERPLSSPPNPHAGLLPRQCCSGKCTLVARKYGPRRWLVQTPFLCDRAVIHGCFAKVFICLLVGFTLIGKLVVAYKLSIECRNCTCHQNSVPSPSLQWPLAFRKS